MQKTKRWLLALMCLVMACIVAIPLATTFGQASDVPVWDEFTESASYVVDDEINIPDRKLTVSGETYDSQIKLQKPDGSFVIVDSGKMTFSDAGKYKLIYEAKAGSVYYSDKIDLTVADKYYRVSQAASSAVYKTPERATTAGVTVRMTEDDTLTFNKIIDINELEASDTLVSGYITPNTVGTHDFDRLVFTFTDVYDPTQVMTVQAKRSTDSANAKATSYWTAAGPNQLLGGWDSFANAYITTQKQLGVRGTAITTASFYSQKIKSKNPVVVEDIAPDQAMFTVTYDTSAHELKVNNTHVTDFDRLDYHPSEPTWTGFTSGKVLLSVKAYDLTGETANFCITNVFGYDDLSVNSFIEEGKPEIAVDASSELISEVNGRYSFTPPAVVGGNYPVPAATAFDAYSGSLKVETRVYFNYSNVTNRIEFPINNGTFKVDRAGSYAIVYKATDYAGNVTEIPYWVSAVTELDDPLSITGLPSSNVTGVVCGQKVTVAIPTLTGGSGNPTYTVKAILGDEQVEIKNDVFVPEKAGNWKVVYTATDYAGVIETAEYVVEVTKGTTLIFVDEIVLPKYFVSGIAYDVPTVYANDYTGEQMTRTLADLVIGDKTYKVGETFVPTAEHGQTVKLTFKAGEGSKQATKEIEIVTVNPYVYNEEWDEYDLRLNKMFLGSNYTESLEGTGLKLTATSNGDFDWIFANAVLAENAAVKVKGVSNAHHFDGLKVTFTDSVDSNVSVTMYLQNLSNGNAKINFGDTERELTKGFNIEGNDANGFYNEFTFSYRRDTFYVDSIAVNVSVDDNGNRFDGFPSGKVYIGATAKNALVGNGYYVVSVDNTSITADVISDRVGPRIEVDGTYGGMYNLNDIYVLTTASASDTMDANVKVTVTVLDADGKVVSDLDGLPLNGVPADREYSLKLTSYGQYNVTYNATDANGNKPAISANYYINVFDRVAPTVTFIDSVTATAKVGDQIVLPRVSVSDDYSDAKDIKVYRLVRNPHAVTTVFGYDYEVLSDGKLEYTEYKFTFKNAGVHTFIIYATDGIGNQATVQYTVTVTA